MASRTQTQATAAACLAASAAAFLLGRASLRLHIRRSHAADDDGSFSIVPRLSDGKHEVCQLSLSTVLLMDDARYPWIVLVPRQNDAVEVIDLSEERQTQLWRETSAVSAVIQKRPGVEKLNVAAIGNVCSQLHVHVTGRHKGDASWPGPCYGVGKAEPYRPQELQTLLGELSLRGPAEQAYP